MQSDALYYAAIPDWQATLTRTGHRIAGGWIYAREAEVLSYTDAPRRMPLDEVPAEFLAEITMPRTAIAGMAFDRPQLMGILNVTPDSFSDGGKFAEIETAIRHARAMHAEGADWIDVGGESTRPGAEPVDEHEERLRTAPVIQALSDAGLGLISIDTRRERVAREALAAGAHMLNDVSAGQFDERMFALAAESGAPICLMHSLDTPAKMQENPSYTDALLDIYEALKARRDEAMATGIAKQNIILDPGIGFGKTLAHNLQLCRRLSLFHSLGCPILLGASRKRFIGAITGVEVAAERAAGSVSVAIAGLLQGVQITRVHDVFDTRAAFDMQMALLSETESND